MTVVTEQLLPGGAINLVALVADTVRRPVSPHAEFTRRLLRLFERRGWPSAPRFLGIDEKGREILSYVPGHAAWEWDQPASVRSPESLHRIAELVREFHDLTAGSDLAGDCEVVCHNDLSPRNTIYQDLGDGLRPVAFIDWDIAAPGRRVHDLAHVCWQYLELGPRCWAGADEAGAATCGRLIRLICDGYGLADRTELIETILWWQDRCWRGIQAGADAGDPALIGLRESGTIDEVQAAHEWTRSHSALLRAALA